MSGTEAVERRIIGVQALEAAETIGHRMGRYHASEDGVHRATCQRCGCQVWISTRELCPRPYGPALESPCVGRRQG